MSTSIGPTIGIEGEKQYKQEISSIISQQKELASEIKSVESAMASESSQQDKNRKKAELLNKEIENQEEYISKLNKKYEEMEKSGGATAKQLADQKTKINNATTALNKMKKELGNIPSRMEKVGKSLQTVGKTMQTVGKGLTTYVTAPLAGLAAASVAAWKEVDDGMDTVAKKTGATGKDLIDLQESMKTVATTIPTSFETAGTAIGEVNTKFDVTGTELENLSTQFIKFAEVNDTDVKTSVDSVQKAMAAFGLKTEDAGKLMDAMTATGQKTGISMDSLSGSLVKNAASLQEMGMDAYSAAGFLGNLEQSGANTETVMAGMQKALKNASEDGKTLPQVLQEFDNVMHSTASDQEKLNAAIDLFGSKAGPTIYEACKQGSLDLSNFAADAEEYMGRVDQTFEDIQDPADKFQIALNNAKLAGEKLGGALQEKAAPYVEKLGNFASAAADKLGSMKEEELGAWINTGLVAAAAGPAATAVGKLADKAGTFIEKMTGAEGVASTLTGAMPYVGLAIAAMGGVYTIIETARKTAIANNDTLQEIFSDTSEAIDTLGASTDGLKTTLSEADANIEAINTKAATAQGMVNELEKLQNQSKLTKEEQGRMRVMIGKLNAMYPGLNASLDENTGKLSEGADEIRTYINNAKDMALLKAYTKAGEDALTKLAEAQVALMKAEKASSENSVNLAVLQHNLTTANKEAMQVAGELGDTTGAWSKAQWDANEALAEGEAKQAELNAAMEEAQAVVDEAQGEVDLYTRAQEDLETKLQTTAEEQDNATASAAQYSEEVDGLGEDVSDELSEAEQAWAELYQSTYDSISSQVGLFDELKTESELTAQQMAANLASQAEAYSSYSANLEKAIAMANESTDPNFKAIVQNIADMGIEGAGYLQTFLTEAEAGSETFDEILANYGNAEENKDKLATTLTNIGAEAGDAMDDAASVVASKSGKMKAAGQTATGGLESGVSDKQSSVKKSAEGVKDEVVKALTTTMLASGKDVMAAGGKIDNWLASGISMNKGKVKTAAEGVAAEANRISSLVTESTFKTAGRNAGAGLASGLSSKKEAVKSAAQALGGAADDGTKKVRAARQQYVSAGQYAGEGIAIGLESKRQSILNTAESIANAAAKKIKDALKVKSPSRVTMEIGRYVGEGLAIGMLKEEGTVASAAGTLGDAAVVPFGALKSDRYLPGSAAYTVGTANGTDPDGIYAAVRSGMEDANIGIYMDGREFGRILRDMGVKIA